jgi:hypothetical protein
VGSIDIVGTRLGADETVGILVPSVGIDERMSGEFGDDDISKIGESEGGILELLVLLGVCRDVGASVVLLVCEATNRQNGTRPNKRSIVKFLVTSNLIFPLKLNDVVHFPIITAFTFADFVGRIDWPRSHN